MPWVNLTTRILGKKRGLRTSAVAEPRVLSCGWLFIFLEPCVFMCFCEYFVTLEVHGRPAARRVWTGLGALPGQSARQNTGFWIFDIENHRKNTGFCVGHFAKTRFLPAVSLVKRRQASGAMAPGWAGVPVWLPVGSPPGRGQKWSVYMKNVVLGSGFWEARPRSDFCHAWGAWQSRFAR